MSAIVVLAGTGPSRTGVGLQYATLLDIALPMADLVIGRFDRAEGITDFD